MNRPTTLYLIIFSIAIGTFTNFYNNANIAVQYYILDLTNFQVGSFNGEILVRSRTN